jgi:hypothetical protein
MQNIKASMIEITCFVEAEVITGKSENVLAFVIGRLPYRWDTGIERQL